MCGRYTLTQPGDILTELGADTGEIELAPRYNIAPTQNAPVVRATRENDGRELRLMRWGLIPFWAKDTAVGNRMINARSETVAEKPAFKSPLLRSRCLVLADGFFEWRKVQGGKQPYYIHLKENRPFTIAGLWDRWASGPEGPVESFTILTTEANEKVASLHDRMPVILAGEARDVWLNRSVDDTQALVSLLRSVGDDQIDFTPVSKIVNSPANDVPECVRPIELT